MIVLLTILALFAVLAIANLIFGRLPKRPAAGGGMIQTEFGEIHYLESIGDGLPIVFIHGMPGLAREFDQVREGLIGHHMIAIDRPGYGWSKGKPQDFSNQLDAIAETLNSLGVERAMIVGHSFGGIAALGMAIRHPKLVDRLLLLSPATGGTRIAPQRERQARIIQVLEMPGIRQLADLLFLRIVRRVASHNGAQMSYGGGPETAKQRYLAESVLARHSSVAALANDRLIFNDAERLVSGNLKRVSVPALVVHGEHDTTVPLRNGKRTSDALPNAKLEVLYGDHQLPTKNTAEVVDAALRLLER